MIEYIKSVLWRVAKRLSYIRDARSLKVKDELVETERERERETERDREMQRERDRERERRQTERERDRGGKSTFQVRKKKIDVNNVWLGAADRSGGKNGAKGKVIKKGILIRKQKLAVPYISFRSAPGNDNYSYRLYRCMPRTCGYGRITERRISF